MKHSSLFITFLLFFTSFIHSQERIITPDCLGNLKKIDKAIEMKIRMFTEYPGFEEAVLYQINDSLFSLEINYTVNTQMQRSKKMFSLAEKEAFCNQVCEKIKQKAPNITLDQSGKTTFLITNTLMGALYYGNSISSLLSDDYANDFPALSLLTAGAGFLVPYLAIRNKEISMSQAVMSGYFQTRGFFYGAAAPFLFFNPENTKPSLAIGTITSIAGAITGYQYALKKKLSVEHVTTMGVYGDFGILNGVLASTLFIPNSTDKLNKLAPVSFFAGSAAGLMLGNHIAKKGYYTEGDAGMLYGAGALGAYIPLTLMSLTNSEDYKPYVISASFGSMGGLYFGDRLAKKYDFSNRQAIMITLAQFAGCLTGAGLGYLISSPGGEPSIQAVAIASGIGSLAGFGMMVKHFSKEKNQEDKNLSLKFNVNPMGLLSLTANIQPAPLIGGSLRF